ncbi:hypothetical protein EMIHUDRAFT_450871 [Emiliania huxleyi CCMP1516]|uniref:Fluoride ion transporter CrcB n=2 Tax=Emiliania huxleyi TaxID=2903 RepID=A0A0D3JBS9_EMIH1|nr:hypothetical protein EMIHUDRAFT_450871 [Emiliania huxleyi CCMP1516]EOD20964.1 hypothetical protein EMIHUDRAFT_450871 [Emiliania huxleyi CCMP1516]|eukprot:XP_005773393.1 hypothetical protein EMIHUDRAFT_450871 [Emiliania huxleyi CCMP1516]
MAAKGVPGSVSVPMEMEREPRSLASRLLPPGLADNVLALSLCAQVGMLARFAIGLGTSTGWKEGRGFNAQSSLFTVLPANIVGCLIMGALADGKAVASLLRAAAPPLDGGRGLEMAGGEALPLVGRTPKAWAPLLLGLRTGFCGSLTSFSSWNQAVVALLDVDGDSFRDFKLCVGIATAPFGALLRWKLGKLLNGYDVFGEVAADGNGAWYAEATLKGLGLGFCGCLSTVSTWINEVNTLLSPRPSAEAAAGYGCGCAGVTYALGSVALGLAVGVPAFGWSEWA